MKKRIFLLLFVLFIACDNKNRNELPLFNGLIFKVLEGETVVEFDAQIKERYIKYFNNSLVQIPLFKYIKHQNYDFFIGLPYRTSIEDMKKQDSTLIHSKKDDIFYYKKYQKDNFYMAEYAIKINNQSLIYMSAISDSKQIADSLFNEIAFANRIKIDKQ